MRTMRPAVALGLTALVATLVTTPAAARGGPPADRGGPPAHAGGGEQQATADAPDWTINQTQVDGLAAGIARDDADTVSGEIAGAAYVGQRPNDWNGRLVVWAHGYRGEGPNLTVDPPPLFSELVDTGTAWIASSYRRNSYDPGIGVIDTKNATQKAIQLWGQPDHTYVAGVSMGGHVIGAAIEQFPNLYDGAMPTCGVMGDVELFDYFLDYNLGAAAIADVEVTYPDADWLEDEVPQIREALSLAPGDFEAPILDGDGEVVLDENSEPVTQTRNIWASAGFLGAPDVLTPLGDDFKDFVELGSGGVRGELTEFGFPGSIYDVAWDYWHLGASPTGDFFFELGEGDGTIAFRNGIVGQNSDMTYANEYPGFGDLDEEIVRVEGSKRVRRAQGQKPAPIINGTPQIPVLTMHTIGDLFVPIEMQQIYAEEVAANGLSDNLVQRAIRDVGHCTFSATEWQEAYSDLFNWVEEDVEPQGDDLVNDISNPGLGLQWTVNDESTESDDFTGLRLFGDRAVLAGG